MVLHPTSHMGRKRAKGTVLTAAFTLVFTFQGPRVLCQDQVLSTAPSLFLQPLQQLGCKVGDDDVSTCVGNKNEGDGTSGPRNTGEVRARHGGP